MNAPWALLVYIAGNSDLSDAAGADLKEMGRVGSTENVRVLIFEKRADSDHAYRYEFGQDREDLGPTDSGDPQVVVDFIRWGLGVVDAERYAVVLWNHGSGWAPWVDTISSEIRGGESLPPHERASLSSRPGIRAFFRRSIETSLAARSPSERAILIDAGTNHSVDTTELGRVTSLAAKELGRPIDLLGMDACLMTTLEVLWQVRDDANVLVGSEELEPGTGWPYDRLLEALNQEPHMDPEALGRVIVENYIDSYKDTGKPVTQSAFRLEEASELARAVDGLGRSMTDALPDARDAIAGAQAEAVAFPDAPGVLDLRTFCLGLLYRFNGDVHAAAEAVVAALEPGAGAVIAEADLGVTLEGCGGVSIYLPTAHQPVSGHYADVQFASDYGWDDFLRAYQESFRRPR
jgi:hypothetical protein